MKKRVLGVLMSVVLVSGMTVGMMPMEVSAENGSGGGVPLR